MCLTIPRKILSTKNQIALVDFEGQNKKVNSPLIKIKKGDYVVIQNNMIIQKMSPKQAKKILKLMDSTSSP